MPSLSFQDKWIKFFKLISVATILTNEEEWAQKKKKLKNKTNLKRKRISLF